MRNTARWAATLALTATAVCGPLTGAALAAPAAAPASLYAPSALVLTIGHGDSAAAVTPQRAVTLSCAPTPSGTHPAAALACAELRAAGGLDALAPRDDVLCKRVSYERTFANQCVKDASTSDVFAF
jgi:hypothetical protein